MSLEEKIVKIVKDNLEEEIDVKLDSKLREELNVDSMGRIILINAIEDEFDIEVKDADFEEIQTVQEIVDKLRENYPDLEETYHE